MKTFTTNYGRENIAAFNIATPCVVCCYKKYELLKYLFYNMYIYVLYYINV